VLAAVAASAWLLPAGGEDEPEPASAGSQPCIVRADGEELCGHDAAAWCDMQPSVERETGSPMQDKRNPCIRVLRWASD
jgi:hypothetical protein